MLIGAGHYQSLSHAMTLAVIEPAMFKRKIVLMVSPQWFRKEGIAPGAFASRFSESSFLDMIQNDELPAKTRYYIADRSIALLKDDPQTQKRVISYRKQLLEHKANSLLTLKTSVYKAFLDDKQKQSVLTLAAAENISYLSDNQFSDIEPDWKIKSQIKERKGSSYTSRYAASPEYDDLRCFLDVCQSLNIEPMLILLPVNGRWYDYTSFPKERRDEFYKNVQTLALDYPKATLTDLSKDDYTDYFMEDTIHIGWKGWVDVNEILYKFGH